MWDQTPERATHPSSKIYIYLWKSSPEYPSVFPNAFQFRHTEAPLLWRLELLAATQSSQVSLHTLIYRPRAAKCGQPAASQTLPGSSHPPTTSTNLILVTGMTGLPPLLSRDHLLPNELACARWPNNVTGISTTVKVQTTFSWSQNLKDSLIAGCHMKWPQHTEKLLLIVIETQTHDNKFINLTLQHLEKVLVLLWNYSAARNKSPVSFGLFSWHQ